jgi:methylglutaconyl-CoA hydratase
MSRRDGAVEYVTLNRPDVRNAFNPKLIAELTAWAAAIANDRTVRAIVLAGAGRMFCAGADVAWMAESASYTKEQNLSDARAMSSMFSAIDALPVPVVGRVHGAALGGGAGLACVCDVVVADEHAIFGFTEVKLGIIPAVISPFALAKIGRAAARELFLTGARFSALRAKEIGLVHAVVPLPEMDDATGRFVREFLSAAPGAIEAAKALIPKVWASSGDEAQTMTAKAIAERRVSAEGQEGLRAFLEKRKPNWGRE